MQKIVLVNIIRSYLNPSEKDDVYAVDLDQLPENSYKNAVTKALNEIGNYAIYWPKDLKILKESSELALEFPFTGTVIGSVFLFIEDTE